MSDCDEMIRVPCADWQKMQADLAAANARADGYALLVAEYRTALRTYGGHSVIGCHVVGSTECVCGLLDILAADPEAPLLEQGRSREGR